MSNWGDKELRALLALANEEAINRQMTETVKNGPTYKKIAEGLTSRGFPLTKPNLNLHEPLYVRRYWRPELPSFSTPHQGKGGYWWSPQRYQEVGSTWRDTRRRRVVIPGNTGFSDVPSSLYAGYCRIRPTLVWRYRWQKLRERVPQVLKGRDNFLVL